MELTIDFTAELPAFPRQGGRAGTPAVAWEELLDPARQHPGRPGRLEVFEDRTDGPRPVSAKSQATSRSATISTRLRTEVPKEEWRFNTRELPDGTVGLWVTFLREMTDEEFADSEKRRAERVEKIRAGKAAKKAEAANGSVAGTQVADTESAVEKVKAAREAKAVSA